MNELLIIAVGNDARGDDGLGWRFAERIAGDSAAVEFRYQLQIEDAELIANYRRVVFVDACVERCPGGFSLGRLAAGSADGISTHRLSPETVVALAESLFQWRPEAYLLRIDGESFELGDALSATARRNLENAVAAWTSRRKASEFEDAFAQDP